MEFLPSDILNLIIANMATAQLRQEKFNLIFSKLITRDIYAQALNKGYPRINKAKVHNFDFSKTAILRRDIIKLLRIQKYNNLVKGDIITTEIGDYVYDGYDFIQVSKFPKDMRILENGVSFNYWNILEYDMSVNLSDDLIAQIKDNVSCHYICYKSYFMKDDQKYEVMFYSDQELSFEYIEEIIDNNEPDLKYCYTVSNRLMWDI